VDSVLVVLARDAVDGDPTSWRALWCRLEPLVWGLTGKWQILGPLCRRNEDRRNVVLAVMEKLRDSDFRRLRAFVEADGPRSDRVFRAWIATVSTRVGIDYTRAHPECIDPRGKRGGERWVKIVPLPDPAQSPMLDPARRIQVLRVLDRARSELRPEQLVALAAWLEGEDAAGIAMRLGSEDPDAAKRMLHSALKRLRDHFGQPAEAHALEEPT
jgi:DNA-directed RNA polymerase specialized sigma24 family protein